MDGPLLESKVMVGNFGRSNFEGIRSGFCINWPFFIQYYDNVILILMWQILFC